MPKSITITSDAGVGGTTTLEILKRKLEGLGTRQFVSAGLIMRAFAKEKGKTIEEFVTHAKNHPEEKWDEKVDQRIAELGRNSCVVAEGRLPHIFVPNALHVLLVCSLEVRAKRRHKDLQGSKLEEVTKLIQERDRVDRARYEALYPGSNWEPNKFDLVIDTGITNPEDVAEQILNNLEL